MVSPIIISKTLDQAASRTDLWNAKKSTIEKEQQKSKTGVEAEEKVVEMSFGVVVFFLFPCIILSEDIFVCICQTYIPSKTSFCRRSRGYIGRTSFFFYTSYMPMMPMFLNTSHAGIIAPWKMFSMFSKPWEFLRDESHTFS